MKDLKRNIAIVCGGNSSEHEVSLRSARGIYSFFDKEKYNVYIVDIELMNWKVDLGNGEKATSTKTTSLSNTKASRCFLIMPTSPSMARPAKTVLCKAISNSSICLTPLVACWLRH